MYWNLSRLRLNWYLYSRSGLEQNGGSEYRPEFQALACDMVTVGVDFDTAITWLQPRLPAQSISNTNHRRLFLSVQCSLHYHWERPCNGWAKISQIRVGDGLASHDIESLLILFFTLQDMQQVGEPYTTTIVKEMCWKTVLPIGPFSAESAHRPRKFRPKVLQG